MPRETAFILCTSAVLGLTAACAPPVPRFSTAFDDGIERVWVGPDFYGNRLQDWRLHDGRAEAVEGRSAKPMRTLQLLTASLGSQPGDAAFEVRTGPVAQAPAGEDTWTGFLLGAGGPGVDYRVSALVHHWPSTDGGIIVGVDGTGAIVVRDNSVNRGIRGPVADIPLDAWPLIEPASRSSGVEGAPRSGSMRLRAEITATGEDYRLAVRVVDDVTGQSLGSAVYDGIPAEALDGGIGLASHGNAQEAAPGYWFDDLSIQGSKVELHPERAFGPVLGAFYTLGSGTLKLTAQFAALSTTRQHVARLEVEGSDSWRTVGRQSVDAHSFTSTFRVDDWDGSSDARYRVVLEDGQAASVPYEGRVRREPTDKDEIVVAAFTGHNVTGGDGQWNGRHFWFPHTDLTEHVDALRPDLLFFSGDQIYEAGLAGVDRRGGTASELDYLYHWNMFVWAFRDLARDLPTVMLPDDHDVYHGNIWGNGGESFEGDYTVQDRGGYRMAPSWVNLVHRTQVSNLPDPVDPEPLPNGISVYHTRLEYAGVSFAIVADRMFKSPPSPLVPEGGVVNGWFHNREFDPITGADVAGAQLLGARQERFLDTWAADWSQGAWMKVLLSQTPFADVATLPDSAVSGSVFPSLEIPEPGVYVQGDRKAADADSGGWPQTPRNRAVRTLRSAYAFHISGDQHLGSFLRYGADDFNDGGYSLVVPSIANFWPRRWFPPRPGANREQGAPAYTGEFLDGFGNHMTVLAVSNPARWGAEPAALHDRSPGFGIVRFRRDTRDITVALWPRYVDPTAPGAAPYPGWPRTVSQFEGDGRRAVGHLPTLSVEGMEDPVVQVVDETSGEVVYTVRVLGAEFRPPVFDGNARYTVRMGEPGTARMAEVHDLTVTTDPTARTRVRIPAG